MTRVFLLITLFVLTACESDFEECMKVEVPEAEERLSLTAEREALTNLIDLSGIVSNYLNFLSSYSTWLQNNPSPESRPTPPPSGLCLDALTERRRDDYRNCVRKEDEARSAYDAAYVQYKSSPEYLAWVNKREAYFLESAKSLKNGIQTRGDVEEFMSDLLSRLGDALKPRAMTFGCWGAEFCDNALWAEFLSQNDVSIENDFSGVFLVGTKSLVEAELMQIEKIRKVERNIAELAVASCNSKGLYE